MGARERFEALAQESAYGSSKGLFVIPLRRGGQDAGELLRLRFAVVSNEHVIGKCVESSVSFDVAGNGGFYTETYLLSTGLTAGQGHRIRHDFSESYRMADTWQGWLDDEGPEWHELDGPRPLIDFLAERLHRPI